MEKLLELLAPGRWIDWIQAHPMLTFAIAAPIVAAVAWSLFKGHLGTRRAVINIVAIGLVVWGSLWFADWVKPSLTSEDLFVTPVVGPQAVKAAFVEQKSIERTATYTVAVHPYERIVLRARIDGFVESVAVYPGDRMEKDQVPVKIETSQLVPELIKARAELRYLRAELERDRELFEAGATPRSVLDLSKSKAEATEAAVRLLKTQIGYGTVRAPSDGWVSRRAVDPGQYVRTGDHLLAYDRLDKARVRFDVAIQDLAQIRPGSVVVLEFPEISPGRLLGTVLGEHMVEGYSDAAVRAEVTSVFPAADERSRLGTVEAVIPNPGLLLKSNTYVIGHFVTGRVENAWVVPERALTPMPGGKTVVFLAPAFSDQGAVEMHEVRVGLRNGREAEIVDGLEEPAYVVVAGNRSITNGETVDVIAREGGSF